MPNAFGVEVTPSGYDYSCYVSNSSILTNTVPSFNFFSERNGYITSTEDAQVVPGRFYELGHDDFLFQTDELDVSLKELMNRIYKLEIEVYELKQQLNLGGTIKL